MKKYKLVLFTVVFIFILFSFNINYIDAITTTASNCVITSTLRVGSTGDEVACLQTRLGLFADGKFGLKTKTAAILFQKNSGLVADGVFGAKSRAIWFSNNSVSGNFPPGCTSTQGFSLTTGKSCSVTPTSIPVSQTTVTTPVNTPIRLPTPISSTLKDNSNTYFKDIFGVNYSLVTDETPSLYDKNHGIGGFQSDFSWKNNSDLLAKVNEITSGLTDNKQKAEAIGAWVANSRVYAAPAVISSGTIYSIFKATSGICIDAAYLTTAMLRLADIPARPVSPMAFLTTHEYTEFYYQGQWYGLDSTFGFNPGSMSPKAFKISTPVEVMNQTEIPVSKQIIQKDPFSDDKIFVYNVKKIIQPLTISKKNIPVSWGYLKVINPSMPLGIVYQTIYSWVEPTTQSCDYDYCNPSQSGGVGFNINSGLEFSADRLTYQNGTLTETIPVSTTVGSTTNAQVYKIPLPTGKYRYWFGGSSEKFVYEDIEVSSDQTTLININGLVNNKLSTIEFDKFKINLSEQINLFNYGTSLTYVPPEPCPLVYANGIISHVCSPTPIIPPTIYPSGCQSNLGYSLTTGMACDGTQPPQPTYPSGCTSTSGWSSTTGNACNGSGQPQPTYPSGCTSYSGYSSVTGMSCDGSTYIFPTTNFPSGCNSTSGWSSTTGLACDGTNRPQPVYPSGCTSYSGYSLTTGNACNGTAPAPTYPSGCTSTSGWSTTTGNACDGSGQSQPVYHPGCSSYSGYSSVDGESCSQG